MVNVSLPRIEHPQRGHAARQLFNEAMDPATLDGANTNLPSKGSTLHGTGRPGEKPWERSYGKSGDDISIINGTFTKPWDIYQPGFQTLG